MTATGVGIWSYSLQPWRGAAAAGGCEALWMERVCSWLFLVAIATVAQVESSVVFPNTSSLSGDSGCWEG